MAITQEQVIAALGRVEDPDLHRDLVTLGHVKAVKVLEGAVSVDISTPSPQKEHLRAAITAVIGGLDGVEEIYVNFAGAAAAAGARGAERGHGPAGVPGHDATAAGPRGLRGVKHIVAVGAGKGGVGKSTVAVNLALGLALAGRRVGLLDGDIYGPSLPTLVGIAPRPPEFAHDKILPFFLTGTAEGPQGSSVAVQIAVMSLGFMVDKEKALIWRGPMAHGAMKQMIEEVDWIGQAVPVSGPTLEAPGLDYLIVDLPPGTGDISLTLAQTVPLTGAVIIATPQEVALADARRAVRMFQQLGVEVLGVVENMSYFICEHGTEYDIFGRGGAQAMAQEMGLPFLGSVPIDVKLRRHSDEGTPLANFAKDSPSRRPLLALSDMLDKQVAVRLATRPEARPLTLKVT